MHPAAPAEIEKKKETQKKSRLCFSGGAFCSCTRGDFLDQAQRDRCLGVRGISGEGQREPSKWWTSVLSDNGSHHPRSQPVTVRIDRSCSLKQLEDGKLNHRWGWTAAAQQRCHVYLLNWVLLVRAEPDILGPHLPIPLVTFGGRGNIYCKMTD